MTPKHHSEEPIRIPVHFTAHGSDETLPETAENTPRETSQTDAAASPSSAGNQDPRDTATAPDVQEPSDDQPPAMDSAKPETLASETAPSSRTAELEKQLEESLAREKRWLADLANYRNRTERMFEEQADQRKRAVVTDLLEIIDDLDCALDHAADVAAGTGAGSGEGLAQGIKAVREKMIGILARHGFTPFAPLGEPFDPMTQEAMALMPHPTLADNQVAQVMRRGWKVGEKMLRPARVIVVKQPETAGDEAPSE